MGVTRSSHFFFFLIIELVGFVSLFACVCVFHCNMDIYWNQYIYIYCHLYLEKQSSSKIFPQHPPFRTALSLHPPSNSSRQRAKRNRSLVAIPRKTPHRNSIASAFKLSLAYYLVTSQRPQKASQSKSSEKALAFQTAAERGKAIERMLPGPVRTKDEWREKKERKRGGGGVFSLAINLGF